MCPHVKIAAGQVYSQSWHPVASGGAGGQRASLIRPHLAVVCAMALWTSSKAMQSCAGGPLHRGHSEGGTLSNEDTVCSPNYIELCINLPLNSHLFKQDSQVGPNGVHHREIPLVAFHMLLLIIFHCN